jgi:Amt family ammonium transporter
MVAGGLVTLAVVLLEMHMAVDDPGGAISVHGVAGIWGLLAVGIFPHVVDGALAGGRDGQLLAQVVGIATLLGVMLPMIYGLNWLIDRLDEQRVTPHGERIGMDLQELGGSAYPEFIVYNEE